MDIARIGWVVAIVAVAGIAIYAKFRKPRTHQPTAQPVRRDPIRLPGFDGYTGEVQRHIAGKPWVIAHSRREWLPDEETSGDEDVQEMERLIDNSSLGVQPHRRHT